MAAGVHWSKEDLERHLQKNNIASVFAKPPLPQVAQKELTKQPEPETKFQESAIQISCIEFFDQQYPQYANLRFKCDNEGKHSKYVGYIKMREGKLPGVSDVMFPIPTAIYHGLFCEFKRDAKAKQSPSQVIFQKNVEAQGYKYIVIFELETFQSEIAKYFLNK